MTTVSFLTLPYDIHQHGIRPFLSKKDRLMLAIACFKHIPTNKDFSRSIQCDIVRSGLSLTLLFWKRLNKNFLWEYAAETGSLDVMKHLHAHHIPMLHPERPYRLAALNGHLTIIRYLFEIVHRFSYWDSEVFLYAAKGGQLDLLKHYEFILRSNDRFYNRKSVELYGNNKDYENPFKKFRYAQDLKYRMVEAAAKTGNCDILSFLLKIRFSIGMSSLSLAASSGDMRTFTFVYDLVKGNIYTSKPLLAAISSNNLEIVRFWCENIDIVTDKCLTEAIQKERIEIVSYLLEIGYRWLHEVKAEHLYHDVIRKKNLSLLKILDSYGWPRKKIIALKVASTINVPEIIHYLNSIS